MNMKRNKKLQAGFTLLEILITVAIVVLLAAISIPKYLSAKRASNEAAVISSLKGFVSAENIYQALYGGFAATLGVVTAPATPNATCSTAGLLDPTQWSATPQMSGYNFTISIPGTDSPSDVGETKGACTVMHSFSVVAVPVSPSTGTKGFYVDDGSTVRYTPDGTSPGPTSTPIGQ
jgi:type IV pilus assembly protein PilA